MWDVSTKAQWPVIVYDGEQPFDIHVVTICKLRAGLFEDPERGMVRALECSSVDKSEVEKQGNTLNAHSRCWWTILQEWENCANIPEQECVLSVEDCHTFVPNLSIEIEEPHFPSGELVQVKC